MSTITIEDEILQYVKSLPDIKKQEIKDFAEYLFHKENIKMPNKETLKALKDSRDGNKLNTYNNSDELFKKLNP